MSRKRTEIISPDKDQVEALLRTVTDARDKERLIVARMAMSGQHTLAMMAETVGRARSCIQRWLERFESRGVEGLLERISPPGSEPSLNAAVQAELVEKLRAGTWRTGEELRRWLRETHGINLSLGGCYYWLGKCGGRLKAPRPSHHRQAPGAVAPFKMEGWEERLASLDLPAGKPVRFWVMDEPERSADSQPTAARRASATRQSRFGLHSVVRRCWGLRGERVVKPFQQRFDWEYLYGAVDILTGEPVFCHLPTVSCQAVWQFLGELVKTDPAAHHVVLWDGAGFHQPPDPNDPEWAELSQVQVLKLPPYCPELNPTEKIWDQLKDAICNQVFESIEALRTALLPKLKAFWEHPEGLSSLIGLNWLRQKVNASSPIILPVFN